MSVSVLAFVKNNYKAHFDSYKTIGQPDLKFLY